jgi:2-polyprenyl-3-methyl-5-hydroxy-6-metoxy-1,4-benzoquinol methylase
LKTSNDKTSKSLACPSCSEQDIRIFHEIQDVPVNSVMNCYTREQALSFPRGEIILGLCGQCGFIYNTAFERDRVNYSSECEESQGYSPTFNAFAKNLAEDLVDKYDLYEKRIIEIGCGKGEFLKLICNLGQNSGVGFDPAYIPGRSDLEKSAVRIEFVKDYYSEKYTRYEGDFICCRMTLEHIYGTADLVRTVRRSIGHRSQTVVFFQVPDVTRIMQDCAFEDIYYEHCSYFSPGSLVRLFQQSGFDVVDLQTAYDDQYICLEAKPADQPLELDHPLFETVDSLKELVNGFEKNYPAVIDHWRTQLDRFKQQSQKVVVWGSGSKGVTFLNTVAGANIIDYVVDIHPFRQQTFMAGSGQQIVPPTFLNDYQPDAVIIMNAIYRQEIQQELTQLGLKPVLMTLDNRETLVA